jgi:hypothetical protein
MSHWISRVVLRLVAASYSLNALVFMVVSMLVLNFEAQEMVGSLVKGLHFRAAIAKE